MSGRSDPVRLVREADGHVVDAIVSPVGAALQRLRVDGVDLVRGAPDGPVAASGAVLVPWPNRVRGARWMLGGEPQRLEPTEPGAGNALHGLVAGTRFRTSATADAVQLTADVMHPPGYPFALEVAVSYRLTSVGVDAAIALTNRSGRPAPVAVGVHPYLRVGDAAAGDLRVQLQADRTLLLGADNLPLGEAPVAGTTYDLRLPTPVRQAPAHAAFTALSAVAGRVAARLTDLSRSFAVELWADERFRWMQLYVPDRFPGLGPDEVAVALEPMTAPPDALNSGIDLEWLAPAATWTLRWGIALR